ncbi:MlaA family lipoprotein [Luteimonas huabeiensis]|uniref:MlaA family lipoprotein n=1 Tax=Luteimonas huabeiensis TaxID=1244513 RepID=UPI0004664B6C|nr:VacJ family lipoprotein [Luteimonas huabeiensis]
MPLSRLLAPCLLIALAGCAGGQQATRAPAPTAPQETAATAATSAAPPADAAVPDAGAPTRGRPPGEIAQVAREARAAGAYKHADGGRPVLAPTQAELDYAAIYGEVPYDPVADPTLPEAAQMATAYDPWEPFNRRMHRFNNVVDRTVARPLATAYMKVVPRPIRLGVSNFFSNLGQPVSALNALLQGRPKQAGQALGRFVVNATLGIGGIFDPASDADIPFRSEDFGQTLGVWGWRNSRYLELPLFGPRTLRDTFGLAGDAPLSPTRQIDDDGARWAVQGLQLVDVRTQLFAVDRMREGAADDYALVRDAWMQRRQYQIFGDREGDETLPDYLLDDDALPTVPADAIPVIPGVPVN